MNKIENPVTKLGKRLKVWFCANILSAVTATVLVVLGMTVLPELLLAGATLALGTYISANQWIGVNREYQDHQAIMNGEKTVELEDIVEETKTNTTQTTKIKSNAKEAEVTDSLEK